MSEDPSELDEIVEVLLFQALTDLEDAHMYTEQNPTFRERWGAISTSVSEYPRLPEGSELSVEGEREFWFKYGRYAGILRACMDLDERGAEWPRYRDLCDEFGEDDKRVDSLPIP